LNTNNQLRELSLIRIFLVLALIILAFFVLRKFLKTSPEIISGMIQKTGVILILTVIVFFTATGKLNWLFALVGVFIAFLLRVFPIIMRYIPQLHALWKAFNKSKNQSSSSENTNKYKGKISKEEAYDILGLSPSATEKEIVMAHRKLMQKMHPDRGGSDYLAAKINLAKKVLLSRQ
jgi:hypothetical protein